jgi:predicted nucleic acid-binding protein
MIVVDASIIGPIILPDKSPLSETVAEAIATERLIAPYHLPLEVMNMLIMTERKGRITRTARQIAIRQVRDLSIILQTDTGDVVWTETSKLADLHRLTVYDAAYLELAIRRHVPLATRDGDLIDAARAEGVEVLT